MEVGTIAATLSPSALARLRDLEELYRARWQELPTFACRAPGRVNLIGEHIDYHRFSVLCSAQHISCFHKAALTVDNALAKDRGLSLFRTQSFGQFSRVLILERGFIHLGFINPEIKSCLTQ